jgi:uncharacterized membrane protein YebE (DUF533 family)
MQGGLSNSGSNRINHALGDRGLGGSGGLFDQVQSGASHGGSSGGLGGLMDMAKSMFGNASRSVQSGNPAAVGGLGALAGALLGGGSGSVKGALGGGAMALLGSLALDALRNMNQPEPTRQSIPPAELPLGMRPPANAVEETELESTAKLILKAMISAAKADGRIDEEEMRRIVGRLQEAGADAEAQAFVRHELSQPLDLGGLIRAVPNRQVAVEVYGASLFAIEVDTPEERDYLRQLADGLGLDQDVVQRIHRALGVA